MTDMLLDKSKWTGPDSQTLTTNDRRAREANAALQAYRLESNDADLGEYEDIHACVALLAAIRHLCDCHGWDYGYLDKQAQGSYEGDIDGGNLASVDALGKAA